MVRVKYCGITNIEDAVFASRIGVSALGFVFAKSQRIISPDNVREISDYLGPFICTGGVFVNEPQDLVAHMVKYCRLNFVQLHGDEPWEYIENLVGELNYQKGKKDKTNVQIIKAFKIKDEKSISRIIDYPGKDLCDAYILDTYSESTHGGTGKTFNWEYFNKVKKEINVPLILAGGLNTGNVYRALIMTNPLAIDVSSGIEVEAKKDKVKMKKFIEEVWRWQSDVFW